MAPEKRYQVFVSSTFADLQDERRAVVQTLLEFGAIPAGMELFPAADEDAWGLISRVVEECDYYLLVIGGRYGSTDNEGLSFTEKEYEYATSVGKPTMAFLHQNPDKIPLEKSEKKEQLRERLTEFREKVETTKHVKYWSSAEDLAGKVALTLPKFFTRYPAEGWVRASALPSADSIAELNALRKKNFELVERLREAENRPPPGTEEFAQGDDLVEVTPKYEVTARDKESFATEGKWEFSEPIEKSWNELFKLLAPHLIQEAEQREIREALEKGLWQQERSHIFAETREWAKKKWEDHAKRFRISYKSFNLSEEDFQTVIVQLVALNLIEPSRRTRSVRDRGTYWTLTPYGNTQLIRLRALRREIE